MDMTGLNLEAIGEWHNYFESAGMDVFQVIENAIKVAVWYRPDEFLMRGDEIAQLLFKKQSVRPNGDNTRVYSGAMNHRQHEPVDRNEIAQILFKKQSVRPPSYAVMNHGGDEPLHREAKVEEQPKSTTESTSCTATEISKHEEDNFSSTREEQNPKAREIIKINLSKLRNRGKRIQIFEDVESGVSKSPISSVRNEVCDEAKQTKNPVSGPWDESVAATRKTELLTTSSEGKLVPNLEKDVQNTTEISLKQMPESKIVRKLDAAKFHQ